MKRTKIPYLVFTVFLIALGCNGSKTKTSKENPSQTAEVEELNKNEEVKKYTPVNVSNSSFWGDTTDKFDVTKFSDLLKSDSIQSAYNYLEKNKPTEMDSINLNIYKSNLSNVLIRQGKFDETIRLLSDVINTSYNSKTIPQRLLRSEALAQLGLNEEAMIDLSYVIANGGRYRWRAYRQRGIIKYEILRDTVGGCEDLKRSVSNSHSKEIYKKYCD